MFANVQRVKLTDIKIDRIKRQRQHDRDDSGNLDVESDGLLSSIKRNGVISPILINKDNELIFGERRFEASRIALLEDIPAVFIESLTPLQAECFELIENIRRKSLHWLDEVKAVKRFHEIALKSNPEWSDKQTGQELGYAKEDISRIFRVADDINDDRIQKATHLREAYNLLSRRDDRARQDLMNEIDEIGRELDGQDLGRSNVLLLPSNGADKQTHSSSLSASDLAGQTDRPLNGLGASIPSSSPTSVRSISQSPKRLWETRAEDNILNIDFKDWLATYNGPRFNFIHCDFPYGKSVFAGPQSGRDRHEATYDDAEDIYWSLITEFCSNIDKFMSPSAHLMFWLENDIETQSKTIQRFRDLAPSLIFNTTPIVWHKTDNVGIASDAKRWPRNVYETALLASRDDRLLIRTTSNAYGAQTDKALHPSTKPESVLKSFFAMFIDSNSRVLDPTCGSGSALRAAESLGAQFTLGLERDPSFHKGAIGALQAARNKRRLEQ